MKTKTYAGLLALVLSANVSAGTGDIWAELTALNLQLGASIPTLSFSSNNEATDSSGVCQKYEYRMWARTPAPGDAYSSVPAALRDALPYMCDEPGQKPSEGCTTHFKLIATSTPSECTYNFADEGVFENVTIPSVDVVNSPDKADIRIALVAMDEDGTVQTVRLPNTTPTLVTGLPEQPASNGGGGDGGNGGGSNPPPMDATQEELKALLVTKTDRNIPFSTVIRLGFEHRQAIRRVQNIQWQMSKDGGVTWETPKNPNGTPITRARISRREKEREHLMFKAEYDLDGQHYVTETKDVYALIEPKVRIEGPNVTYSAYPITQTAVITNNIPGDITWEVFSSTNRKVPMLEQDGTSLTLQGLQPGGYIVVARSTENPAYFEGHPGRGIAQQTVVVVATNEVVEPTIKGLRNIKVGKTYSYQALLPGAFSSARARHDLTITGAWSLSDGSQQEGSSFTFTPTTAGEVTATFQGYVTQLPEVLVQGMVKLKATEYVWPQWTLSTEATGTQVPVRIMAQAKMVDPAAGKAGIGDEVPQYEWILPEGARVVSQVRNTLIVDLTQPGTQTLGVRVFDTLGHEAILTSDEFAVADSSPDFQIDALASFMDNNDLAPGKINVRLSVLKVPTKDLFKTFRVKNGETVLAETTQKYVTIPLADAGNYQLTVEAETKYGVKKQRVLSVPLRPAPAPQCALSLSSETTRVWRVASNCSVAEGTIPDLTWEFADKVSSGTTRLMEFRKADFPQGLTVKVTATTNKGLKASSTVTLQPPQ